jgi:hypothetical protein
VDPAALVKAGSRFDYVLMSHNETRPDYHSGTCSRVESTHGLAGRRF